MEETIDKIVNMLNERKYTLKDIKELEKGELPHLAEPTVKKVVDLLAERIILITYIFFLYSILNQISRNLSK